MHDPASIPLPVGVSLSSDKHREALIPPNLEGKGGRGVRSAREFKVSKSWREMSIRPLAKVPNNPPHKGKGGSYF
jgi:hypothetical protein